MLNTVSRQLESHLIQGNGSCEAGPSSNCMGCFVTVNPLFMIYWKVDKYFSCTPHLAQRNHNNNDLPVPVSPLLMKLVWPVNNSSSRETVPKNEEINLHIYEGLWWNRMKLFYNTKFFYKHESNYVKRTPDWRNLKFSTNCPNIYELSYKDVEYIWNCCQYPVLVHIY
jgi:hypothetical protein